MTKLHADDKIICVLDSVTKNEFGDVTSSAHDCFAYRKGEKKPFKSWISVDDVEWWWSGVDLVSASGFVNPPQNLFRSSKEMNCEFQELGTRSKITCKPRGY
jgi:hypothetical protein